MACDIMWICCGCTLKPVNSSKSPNSIDNLLVSCGFAVGPVLPVAKANRSCGVGLTYFNKVGIVIFSYIT
jgi:hypothetical protein